MEKKIVTERAEIVRGIARSALQGNWGKAILGVGIYSILGQLIPNILSAIFPETYVSPTGFAVYSVPWIFYLYTAIVTGALSWGLASFMLELFRKREINPGNIFNGFGFFFKSLGLEIMKEILIGWPLFVASIVSAILLIVTGFQETGSASALAFILIGILIIGAVVYMCIGYFIYSQVYFIIAEDPTKGIMQCLKESKMLMQGNKKRLFCIQFSFIGWAFLSAIPSGIFVSFTSESNGIVNAFIDFIGYIPVMFVILYLQTATVAFYDLLTGKLIAKPAFNEADYNFDVNINNAVTTEEAEQKKIEAVEDKQDDKTNEPKESGSEGEEK